MYPKLPLALYLRSRPALARNSGRMASKRGRPKLSNCLALGVADEDKCASCLKPSRKLPCLLARAAAGVEASTEQHEQPAPRARTAPTSLYVPSELRRDLPAEPCRMGIQLQRSQVIQKARRKELDDAHADGHQVGVDESRTIVAEVEARLEQLAEQLVASKKQCANEAAAKETALAVARKASAVGRQRKILTFFTKPLEHQARPCATPLELGEGYTNRNILSGTFALHVKAIEVMLRVRHTLAPHNLS